MDPAAAVSPSAPGRARGHALFVAAAAACGFALVWLCTEPWALVHVNWDAGSYLHQIASGKMAWSERPWNAHFALQYAYLLSVWIARALGGTAADGFRLLDAVCFAAIVGALVDAAARLARSRLLGGLLAAAWATAFVTMFLVFTLEDNIVFLTPAVGVLWVCAVRADVWGPRESVAAGLLAAGAALFSVQGVLYALPPLYVAALLRQRGVTVGERTRDVLLVLTSLLLGLYAFVFLTGATSQLTARELLATLFSRPQPSHFPEGWPAMRALLTDVRGSLRTVGLAVSFQLFGNRVPFQSPAQVVALGADTLALLIGTWFAATVWSLRRRRFAPHVLASTLLFFTVLTALYRDVEYAYLKRTDFLPLIGVLLAASALGPLAAARPRLRLGLAGALALLCLWQAGTSLRWRSAEVAGYRTLDETVLQRRVPGYHGTATGSYFARFRGLRVAHPAACAFVFDLRELLHGRWNPDITGLLWSELPTHLVLGLPAEVAAWPRPVRVQPPDELRQRLRGCEWISPAARARLGPGRTK